MARQPRLLEDFSMTKIWNETGFIDDDNWIVETDELKAADGERALVSLERFKALAAASNEAGLGVVIQPADDVAELQPYLDRIAIVAVVFPAFSDGRAYSHASLLRDRFGYEGEIRAIGDVLLDQVPLMLRCGIDTFAVTNETAVKRLGEGSLPDISLHYQPTTRRSTRRGGYSWRRVA